MQHSDILRHHIDSFCGNEPDALYSEDSLQIKVARFDNIPDVGLTTFISIGLSGHLLQQNSGRDIRQELLITVDNTFAKLPIEEVIFSVSKILLAEHKAVSCGQVLGPMASLFPEVESNLTSLLCSYPAFFPEEFSFFESDTTTVLVELIPIQTSEAEFVQIEGASKFFEMIDEGKVDMLDYNR